MVDYVTTVLGVLQIIIQIVAAYFSYKIYKYNRLSKAWLAVFLALIVMTFRRFTALAINLGVLKQFSGSIQFIDSIGLPFIISVFLLIGLWSMSRSFENFEVVEKITKEK